MAFSLAANIPEVNDWSRQNVFCDLVKQSRGFVKPGNWSQHVAVDENGWPLEPFEILLQVGWKGSAAIYNGTYKVSFDGDAAVSRANSPVGTSFQMEYNGTTGKTNGLVYLRASDDESSWMFVLRFSKGAKNLKVIRPGYTENDLFTFQFTDHLAIFDTLRFMDFTSTNDNPIVSWTDRVLPTDARQSGGKDYPSRVGTKFKRGVAWEYVIDLCNSLKKSPWINVPVSANADYVEQLAELFKSRLDPSLHLYVEYSNELWNGQFKQFAVNRDLAKSVGTYKQPGETDAHQYEWAWRRIADVTMGIGQTFIKQDLTQNRIIPVLCGQLAVPWVAAEGLRWVTKTWPVLPSAYIHGLAHAPYWDIPEDRPLTKGQVLDEIAKAAAALISKYKEYGAIAKQYGLKHLTYECGPDTAGPANVLAERDANSDPRIYDVILRACRDLVASGCEMVNWYHAGAASYDTTYGTWAVTDDPRIVESLKYLALKQLKEETSPVPTPPPPEEFETYWTEHSGEWKEFARQVRATV